MHKLLNFDYLKIIDPSSKEKQEVCYQIYDRLEVQGFFLPKFDTLLINPDLENWMLTKNFYLPLIVHKVDKKINLNYVKDYTYNLLQLHLYATKQKIMPFDIAPDVQYLKDVTLILDFENKLDLWRDAEPEQSEQQFLSILAKKCKSYQNATKWIDELQQEEQLIRQKVGNSIATIKQIKASLKKEDQLCFDNQQFGFLFQKLQMSVTSDLDKIKQNLLTSIFAESAVCMYLKQRKNVQHSVLLKSLVVLNKNNDQKQTNFKDFDIEQYGDNINDLLIFLGSFENVLLSDSQIQYLRGLIHKEENGIEQESLQLIDMIKEFERQVKNRHDVDQDKINENISYLYGVLEGNKNTGLLADATVQFFQLKGALEKDYERSHTQSVIDDLRQKKITKKTDVLEDLWFIKQKQQSVTMTKDEVIFDENILPTFGEAPGDEAKNHSDFEEVNFDSGFEQKNSPTQQQNQNDNNGDEMNIE